VLAAVALVAGCGSAYRPVVTPINPSGPAAQPTSLAVVISNPSPNTPGVASIIDYSGDDIMAQQFIGAAPLGFTVDENGTTAYTINSDTTLTSFPVSTGFQEKNIQNITLFTTTQITGLFSPSTGLWAADLDKNVADSLTGSPATFNLAIPVAPIPVAIVGPTATGQRDFAISQNGTNAAANNIPLIPYDTTCNTPSLFPTLIANGQTGEADAIEVANHTVLARIPVGTCPVYAVESSDGTRLFVLNRGDDTITVINSQKETLDSCACPATGCVNQNSQTYFCHPTLPLSLSAVSRTSITPPNGTSGMPATAGPVYAEYNSATNQLVVADYDGGTISVIDVSEDQYSNDSPTFGATYTIAVGKTAGVAPYPASVTVVNDGNANGSGVRAYTANQGDGTVAIVDLSSRTVETWLPVNGHPRTVVSTANSLYGKVYAASPDSPLLSIIRTDLDIMDTTITVPGNIVDVRVSSQNASGGNSNNTSRIPGAGQPCNLPPTLEPAATGTQTALEICQQLP